MPFSLPTAAAADKPLASTAGAQFGQMAPEDGYAVRWVPDSDFVSPCDGAGARLCPARSAPSAYPQCCASMPATSGPILLPAPPAVRTTLKLTGILAFTGACNRQTTASYLAALTASLPSEAPPAACACLLAPACPRPPTQLLPRLAVAGDAVTIVVSTTLVSAGCQVVTSTAYPDARHTPALALARRLVPTPYPLGTTAFGASSKTPAFLVKGDVTTGPKHDVVSSKFVLLTSATATGPTTGRATAAPIPGNSFTRVSPSPPACHAWASCYADMQAGGDGCRENSCRRLPCAV